MNLIMKGIHTALEPLRYVPGVTAHPRGDADTAAGRIGLVDYINHRRRVRRAVLELSRLSNATLEDIGIERGDIPEIAARLVTAPVHARRSDARKDHEQSHGDYRVTGGAAA